MRDGRRIDRDAQHIVRQRQRVIVLANVDFFSEFERAELVAIGVLHRDRAFELRRAFRERVCALRLFS